MATLKKTNKRQKQKEPGEQPSDLTKTESSVKKRQIRVVGIGASAGGLEALEQFFQNMPSENGLAFVIVQHLDPTRKSSMPEILSRLTKMPVFTAADGMKVEPNSIYLNPPAQNINIHDGALHLKEAELSHGLKLPVDSFLRSLAEDEGPDAICIILSGTGSDGTLGLKAVKTEGGTVFVQDPETATYDGMPRSAISTGLVDFILPSAQIPAKLIAFVQQYLGGVVRKDVLALETKEPLQQIFAIMKTHTGHDFTHYKKATILRRLQRRMSVHGINEIAEYERLLRHNKAEIEALLKDILISVTSFFRDPPAFDALKEYVKEMIKNGPENNDLRIWVAGCATGEEAYSIAILTAECLNEENKNFSIHIYATDIDNNALNIARNGIYPVNIASEITGERLNRFFVKEDKGYRIKKEIRDLIVFAPQDFIKDPPFPKMDIICCRNLLIYLEAEPQKKLLPILHYALKPGGLLFLGTSETIGNATDLFKILDKKWKIYQRLDAIVSPERLRLPLFSLPSASLPEKAQTARFNEARLSEIAEKIFLDNYAPTFAIIDEKYHLVYVRGRTGKYLEITSGQASLSILDMAREGLRTDLASVLYRAVSEKKLVTQHDVHVRHNGGFRTIDLTAVPLAEHGMPPGLTMVVFQEVHEITTEAKEKARTVGDNTTPKLEEELRFTRQNLQSTIEELEAANEEIKSANEELQSNNEELQSSNEELDTSREELQSLNEELLTVNSELMNKTEMLTKANDDLKNYLNRTDIAIIFLDKKLKIRSFTPVSAEVFNLREIDVGRPLDDISSRLLYEGLAADTREVLRTLRPKEIEVLRKDGHWYNMRILPYLNVQNALAGLVVSFLDIDRQKQSEVLMRRLATVVKDSNDAIIICDAEGQIQTWNRGAQKIYGYSEEEALKLKMSQLIPEEGRAQESRFIEDIKQGKKIESLEVKRLTRDGKIIDIWLTASPVLDDRGSFIGVATTERDITERNVAEERINRLNESLTRQTQELAAANRELEGYNFTISNNLKSPLRHMDGFSRALLEEYSKNLDDTGKGYLQRIVEASRLMSQFLDKLMELSSIAMADLNYRKSTLAKSLRRMPHDSRPSTRSGTSIL